MTNHIEEARKLVERYAITEMEGAAMDDIDAALAAAEERGRIEERAKMVDSLAGVAEEDKTYGTAQKIIISICGRLPAAIRKAKESKG